MGDGRAARLLDEAATAAMRIIDLPGWSQTRLAGSLRLRREVVNQIVNRGPSAEPSESRPRMVEACRKIIAFAAVISQKDDAVVPRDVELLDRLDDDAQAYESHKLRLRRVVEDAAASGAYIEAMYRVGELSSHALHAPPRFRIRMIGNVVTAIQRLLDKPESRSIPLELLRYNLRRLTAAEWSARRAARGVTAPDEQAKAADDLAYIRGQVGYALIFNGLLAASDKAVRRGGRRLRRAARLQPSPDYGHWSNLLRATNDLLANGHDLGRPWAVEVVDVAREQQHGGFALAFTRLRDAGELKTLIAFWEEHGLTANLRALLERPRGEVTQPAAARRKKAAGTTAAAILLLVGLLTGPATALAGDGKELSAGRASAARATPSGRAAAPARAGGGAGAMTVPTQNAVASINFGRVSNAPGRAFGGVVADAEQPSLFPAPQLRSMYRGTAPAVQRPRPFPGDRSMAGRREVVRRSSTQQRAALMRVLAQEVNAARARAEGADRGVEVPTPGTANTGSRVEEEDLSRLPLRIEDKAVVIVAEGPAHNDTPRRPAAQ